MIGRCRFAVEYHRPRINPTRKGVLVQFKDLAPLSAAKSLTGWIRSTPVRLPTTV